MIDGRGFFGIMELEGPRLIYPGPWLEVWFISSSCLSAQNIVKFQLCQEEPASANNMLQGQQMSPF